MTTLQLLISTIDDGIKLVSEMVLEPIDGVGYVISWQITGDMTIADCPRELLMRPDVKVSTMRGRGLSRNRNNAIVHASADVCLICDDDCRYTPRQLHAVAARFEADPTLDLATFMMAANVPIHKAYPKEATVLGRKMPKRYYPSSFEIAFRTSSIDGKVKFNEEFGLGSATLWCGEEELFVHDAVRAGLKCVFFPTVIVTTCKPTTSTTRSSMPQVLMGRGAYISIAYPLTCRLRAVKIALELKRDTGQPAAYSLRHILNGIRYYRKIKSRGHNNDCSAK